VRIFHGQDLVAVHVRSSEPHAHVVDPAHFEGIWKRTPVENVVPISKLLLGRSLDDYAAGIGGAAWGPVTPGRPISNGSFTFWTQYPELNCNFLTVREVAERLRVCRATVYRMIDKGQLRALRVSSGAIRVTEDASSGLHLRPARPRQRDASRDGAE
jgi:excisionase family DNA binding protein